MKTATQIAVAAVFAAGMTLAVVVFLKIPFGRELEEWMSDRMFTWRYDLLRHNSADKPDPRLFFVSIDQNSVDTFGRWPFPRAIHGQFLQVLAPQKPQVVTWDIFFTETTQGPGGLPTTQLQPDDQQLVAGAAMVPHMVTAASRDGSGGGHDLQREDTLPTRPLIHITGDIGKVTSDPRADVPFRELRTVSYFGFADADAQGTQREMPLVVNIGGQIFPSLDLQTLMQYWRVDPDHVQVDLGRQIVLTHPDGTTTSIPINEQGHLLINYRARQGDFASDSYGYLGKDLLAVANNQPPSKPLPPLTNNIVVIGVTLLGTDEGPTPIDPYSPLVFSHLNVLNNVLKGDYLHAMSPWAWIPLYFSYLFAIATVLIRVSFYRMIPVAIIALIAGAAFGFSLLFFANLLMPVMVPEIGILALTGVVSSQRFFGEEREKARIKGIMKAYLSDKVMQKILAHPDNLKLGGEKQEITIMFSDLRGFTAYCDSRDPQETMDVLNDYMEAMTQVVFAHEGTVDKYIGDCIMAFWNAPEPQHDHAERAVKCAMAMRVALAEFQRARLGTAQGSFECGIGIHTGEALVGNMGSSLKRNYTAMGSTVNLASRLESLTKKLEERILISEDTFRHLHAEFPLIDRGDQTVAGVSKPVHVYAIVSQEEYAAALQAEAQL